MANIILERVVNLDAPGRPEFLQGTLYTTENQAHTFVIHATRGGQPVTLAGTVSGSFIRPDQNTVALSGSIENGAAVVTLAQSCYVETGRFTFTIFVSDSVSTTAVYGLTGNIKQTETGGVVDPGTIIPSVANLIDEIEAAVASIPPDYSELTGEVNVLENIKSDWSAVGFNQWDEVWEVGGVNGTTGQNTNATGTIRSKNYIPVIPGTKYYFKSPVKCWWHSYGADKSYLGVINYGSSFKDEVKTLGSNVYFLRFQGNAYGNTYNHDICVNISQNDTSIEPHNGQYVAYEKNQHLLYRLIDTEKEVNEIGAKIGDAAMGTTATTLTGAIAEHEGDINDLRAARCYVTPEMFGAIGDGETDDTDALAAMFANSGDAIIIFPKGKTYIISPDSESPTSAIFPLTGKIVVYGNGSTLKIANDSGGYGAIFGCSTYDVTGTIIDGLVFDHNSTNCQDFTVNSSNVLNYARMTFAAETCYQFTFINNIIKNSACTNCLYLNKGLTIKNVLIEGNRFEAIGKTPNNLYHDHSSLYIHGDNIRVVNNAFSGESWGAEGAVTAIEVHPGNVCVISHNSIEKYLIGINYAAVNDAESANGIIQSNVFNTLRHGVIMYSSQFHDHTTGYGINGLVISNNYMRIRNSLSLGYLITNMDYGVGGIVFYHYTTLPIKDVYVTTNLLSYDVETTPGEGESPAHSMQYGAIGIFETSTSATLYEDVIFDDITLINPPGICVAIGASMLGGARGTIKNCRFSNITAINPCGVPYQYSGGGQNYRRGVSIGGTQFIGDIEIDIKFLDADYTKMRNPITLSSGSDSSSANINIRCSIKWSNAPVTGDYLLVTRYDNNTIPKAKIDVNSGSVVANVTKFKAGSCIANEATGKLYYMDTDGTTFSNATASSLFEKAVIAELVRL